jgi:hypothetical protein
MALTRPKYSQIYDTDWKNSVKLATTADVGDLLTSNAQPNSVDGVSLTINDRILVKDQGNSLQNGLYFVRSVGTGSNGWWARTLDANQDAFVTGGLTVDVTNGTVNSNRTYRLTTPDPVYLGNTALGFTLVTGAPSGANTYVQFYDQNNQLGGTAGFTFNKTSNLVTISGNVSATYVLGSGQFLTGLPAGYSNVNVKAYTESMGFQNFSNVNVVAYLSTATINTIGNIVAANIIAANAVVNGNVNASYFIGSGQFLSGLPAGYSNVNVIAYLGSSTGVTVGGNLTVQGNLIVLGNLTTFNVETINTTEYISSTGNLVINNAAPSTSTTTGVIVAQGGMGLGGNLNLGGNIVAGGNVTAPYFLGNGALLTGVVTSSGAKFTTSATPPSIPNVNDEWYDTSTDILFQYQNTGAGGNVWIDTNSLALYTIANSNLVTTSVTSYGNITSGHHVPLANITYDLGTPTLRWRTGYFSANTIDLGGSTIGVTNNAFVFTSGGIIQTIAANGVSTANTFTAPTVTYTTTQQSTSTTNGAIVVAGGVGIAGNLNVGGNINLTTAGVAGAGGNILINGAAGAIGQYLQQGTAGVRWATLSAQQIFNNGSNVTVDVNYVNVSVNGSNVASFNSLGNLTITGNLMPTANVTANIGSITNRFNYVYATASTAVYADLAEIYVSNQPYPPGTVVVFGGEQEVSTTASSHDTRVAGVISTKPAYLMNDMPIEGGVAVALTGRVPCWVLGPVNKGDRLVTSQTSGIAQKLNDQLYQPGCIIGKSLEQLTTSDIKLIEIAVGRF